MKPSMVINYFDNEYNVEGYVVIWNYVNGLASGGFRIDSELTVDTLCRLAKNMWAKQKSVGINVGGAKSGLRLDPNHKNRNIIIKKFFETIRPLIQESYNMGPDLNTKMSELEEIASEAGISSLKMAVGRRRGLTDQEFQKRYSLFESKVFDVTLNKLRAPQAVMSSVEAALDYLRVPNSHSRIVIQGAGNMGAGLALLLKEKGIKVVGWADREKLIFDQKGLPLEKILGEIQNGILPKYDRGETLPSAAIYDMECDVLVLAAASDVLNDNNSQNLKCKSIVEAANLAIPASLDQKLRGKGIFVIPDLLASVGGSIAVQALYESSPTTPKDILNFVDNVIKSLCKKLITEYKDEKKTPREIIEGWSLR